MGKIVKYMAAIVGIIILLFVGALIIISTVIDPNSFKSQINNIVKTHTGRDLNIEGDLGLNLYPDVELTIGNVSLSNVKGFGKKPFLKIRSTEVGVELLPLFSKELKIQKLNLDGVHLNLFKNKKGENNWDDLLKQSESGRKARRQSTAQSETQSSKTARDSKDLLRATNQQPAFLAGFGLGELTLTDSKIELTDRKANKRIVLEQIELNIGKVTPGASTPMNFKLSLRGVKSTEDSEIHFSSNIKPNDNFNGMELNDLQLTVARQKISGNIVIKDFNKRVLTFKLASQQLNLDHVDDVLSEFNRASKKQQKKRSKNRKSEGGVKLEQNEKARAISGAVASTISTDKALPQGSPKDLDVNGTLNVGNLVVANLKLQKLSMNLRAKNDLIELAPIKATAYKGKYEGKMILDKRGATPVVTITESLQGLQSEPFLTDFQQKPSKFTGVLNASGTATADAKTPLKTLNGSFKIEFLDGAIKDINIPHLLRAARAKLKGEPIPPNEKKQTDFSMLTATGKIENGVVNSKDVLIKSPFLRVDGKGSANLITETVDSLLMATLVKSLEGQGGRELKDLVGIPVPIRVAGSFQKPNYKVDLGQLIQKAGKDEVKRRALEKLQKKLDKKGLGDLLKF